MGVIRLGLSYRLRAFGEIRRLEHREYSGETCGTAHFAAPGGAFVVRVPVGSLGSFGTFTHFGPSGDRAAWYIASMTALR